MTAHLECLDCHAQIKRRHDRGGRSPIRCNECARQQRNRLNRERRREHGDKILEYERSYRRRNRERFRQQTRARRERIGRGDRSPPRSEMDVETIAYEQAKDREHYRKRRDDSPPPMPTRDYRDYEDDVIINADSALEAAWSLGRSYSQIANRRAKLRRGDTANYGVRGWTAPEIQLLLIPTKSNESIAEQTGRTTVSVSAARRRFRNNGIDVPRRRRNFSHDEDALILSRTLTGQQIADRTGRSRLTIFQRARQLGVSLNFGAPKWTAQEDHIILSEKSNTVVAQLTSRSVKAVQVRRSKLKRLKCDRMLEGMRA